MAKTADAATERKDWARLLGDPTKAETLMGIAAEYSEQVGLPIGAVLDQIDGYIRELCEGRMLDRVRDVVIYGQDLGKTGP